MIEALGSFIAESCLENLPKRIIEMAKIRLLDLLGAGIAGYRIGLYRPILNLLDVGGTQAGTVWGEGIMVSTRDAALINSFMAHSTYMEDGSRSTGGHPSSAVVPSLLSLGEMGGVSGEKLILALVLGYEIFIRIGKTLYPSAVNRGFQPTAILGALGAAAGCAKILDLDKKGCSNALAISANLGSGLKSALKEPSSQPLQVARSCEGGLVSAMLASQGVKGYQMILEPYIEAHAGSVDKNMILKDLGETYAIEETYLKIHGGCRGNHAPLDVILKIIESNNISVEEIEQIRIGIDSVTAASEIRWPKDGKEAQFSIPFSVAVALVYGDASLFQFTDERLEDPGIKSVMKRIKVEIDNKLDELLPTKRGATAEILLQDGRSYNDSLDFSRGEPEVPLNSEDIEMKFNLLAGEVLHDKTIQVIDIIYNVEKLKTVKDLTVLLKADKRID